MNTSRLQHIIPASVIFLLAATVSWLSFTEEPTEAFLFPRVISVFFLSLALWNLIRAGAGMARVGGGMSARTARNIAPGLLVMLVYVFFLAENVGFYAGATLAFLATYSFYDPAPLSSVKDWIKRIVITAAFIAVIYGLFALLLQVQMPQGFFI